MVEYAEFHKPGLEGLADGLRALHDRYAGGQTQVDPKDFSTALAALEFLTAEIRELKNAGKSQ